MRRVVIPSVRQIHRVELLSVVMTRRDILSGQVPAQLRLLHLQQQRRRHGKRGRGQGALGPGPSRLQSRHLKGIRHLRGHARSRRRLLVRGLGGARPGPSRLRSRHPAYHIAQRVHRGPVTIGGRSMIQGLTSGTIRTDPGTITVGATGILVGIGDGMVDIDILVNRGRVQSLPTG